MNMNVLIYIADRENNTSDIVETKVYLRPDTEKNG